MSDYRVWLNTEDNYYVYAVAGFNQGVSIVDDFAAYHGPLNTGLEHMVDGEWVDWGKQQ